MPPSPNKLGEAFSKFLALGGIHFRLRRLNLAITFALLSDETNERTSKLNRPARSSRKKILRSKRFFVNLYSFSASFTQRAAEASEGKRRSARGERDTEPTFTPSGTQLRLNCCAKNRL